MEYKYAPLAGETDLTTGTVITPATLAAFLADGQEIALLDLREEGLFGEGHAFFAVNLPYSRLELDIRRLVPRRATRIVLAGEPAADIKGTHRLRALGYDRVYRVEGGTAALAASGVRLFSSVNVPSKAFAEAVELAYHTPSIKAEALHKLQQDKADLVILDSRTVDEFTRFHVPGAISCPSAELVHRFADLVPSPETLVVVSCAGRTRGIVGAQALINAKVPNRVVALEGGTQGWRLAGLPVETGATALYGAVSADAHRSGLTRATDLAQRFGIRQITQATLADWRADETRTLYLIDVRTPEEYSQGHLPGALPVPGGQLVQTLDLWVGTRGARIVLADDQTVRATVAAHWLLQLGHDVSILPYDPAAAGLTTDDPSRPVPALVVAEVISTAEARLRLNDTPVLLATDPSGAYRDRHIVGARWVNRSRLEALLPDLPQGAAVLIFGADVEISQLFARDLMEARPDLALAVVGGDAEAWADAGLPVEASPALPSDAERIDFLFWLHDRHSGNAEASRAYLAWEEDLPRQIGSPEQAGFRFPAPDGTPAKIDATALI